MYSWGDVFVRVAQPMLTVVLLLRFSHAINHAGIGVTVAASVATFAIAIAVGWVGCVFVAQSKSESGFLSTMVSSTSRELGTSLSVLYTICCILALATFVSAAAEALVHGCLLVPVQIIDGAMHDLRIFCAVVMVVVVVLSMVRMRRSGAIRKFVFALTFLAIFLYLSGALFHYGDYTLRRVSDENALLKSPLLSEASSLFAVLFPAAIGSFSLLNMNSKLQGTAPRGSLLAILVSGLIYTAAVVFDQIEVFANGSNRSAQNVTAEFQTSYSYATAPIAAGVVLGSTLSALSFLQYSSRMIQSLARSQSFERFLPIARGYGNRDIPLRCVLVAAALALVCTMIGNYDLLCIPTSCFFLVFYALINFCAYHTKCTKPSQPSAPALVSLAVGVACVLLALFISKWVTFVPAFVFGAAYAYLVHSKKVVNEDGEPKSKFAPTLQRVYELQGEEPENEQKYRPQVLLLTGNPAARPGLVDFAHSITRGESLLVCGYVLQQTPSTRSYLLTQKLDRQMSEWFQRREIAAFGATICCKEKSDGAAILLQTVGLGRQLRPNVVMMGFLTNWGLDGVANLDVISDYYSILTNAFQKQVGGAIFRNGNQQRGFDLTWSIRRKTDGEPIKGDEEIAEYVDSTAMADEQRKGGPKGNLLSSMSEAFRKVSRVNLSRMAEEAEAADKESEEKTRFEVCTKHSISTPDQQVIQGQLHRFRKRVHNATIDVWWIREAGGLTMVLPFLLTHPGSYLEGAHIRVFTKCGGQEGKVNDEQKRMTSLLRKFNIDSSDLHILPELNRPPSKDTMDEFNKLIAPFKVAKGQEKRPGMVDEDDLFNLREKTRDYLRAVELMDERSADVDLVAVTLPSARPEIPSTLYLAWIDMLSRRSPPTLLVRGNQYNNTTLRNVTRQYSICPP